MKLSTKLDKNGNRYQAIIDFENKTIKKGYCIFLGCGIVLKTKKALNDFYDLYKNQGFKEV